MYNEELDRGGSALPGALTRRRTTIVTIGNQPTSPEDIKTKQINQVSENADQSGTETEAAARRSFIARLDHALARSNNLDRLAAAHG